MPFAAVVGSVYPAAYMRGSRETFGLFPGEMNFPRCFLDAPSFLCEEENPVLHYPCICHKNLPPSLPPSLLKASALNISPKQ